MISKATLLVAVLSLASCGQPAADTDELTDQGPNLPVAEGTAGQIPQPKTVSEPELATTVTAAPEKLFTRCAACHGAKGSGVPGAFPPLSENINKLAAQADGRSYLIAAVRYGVAGELIVDGQTFRGLMPAQYPALNEADIASVLNYLNTIVGTGQVDEFTVQEVQETLVRLGKINGNEVIALRPK